MSQHIETEPDWSGIRAATVAVGVREAARQASAHLPPEEQRRFTERVMKRCSREGWLAHASAAMSARTSQAMPLSANVRTGAEVVADTLAEGARNTRIGLTRYTERMAKQAADKGILEEAPLYKAVADIHGKMHPEQSAPSIRLSIYGTGELPIEAIDVTDQSSDVTALE